MKFRHAITILIPVIIGSVMPVTSAHSDVVHLRGGGQVEGKVSRHETPKVPYAVVRLDDRLKIAIPESQIHRVADSESLTEYRQRAADTPATADHQYELARWCKQQRLEAQYKYHMQRVVMIDPDHALARAALGFVLNDGKWVRVSELQQSRGLVSVGGSYRLPAEVLITQAKRDADTQAKSWIREIARLKRLASRGGERGGEALAALTAIDDPAASRAIAKELLEASGQSREMRMFWIDKLTSLGDTTALETLVKLGLSDGDSVVREKAIETLQRVAPGTAIANYKQLLRSNDNSMVRRAAEALSHFPDPELVWPLVDALVTEHKTVIPADTSTSVAFNNTGSGGLATGGQAKTIVRKIENPPVLTMLRQLEPSVNFGYDKNRWRHYFANRLSGYSGDMRRDD